MSKDVFFQQLDKKVQERELEIFLGEPNVPFSRKFEIMFLFQTGFSQTELAKKAGLTQSEINHILHNRRKPSLNNLKRLLKAVKYKFSPEKYYHMLDWLLT